MALRHEDAPPQRDAPRWRRSRRDRGAGHFETHSFVSGRVGSSGTVAVDWAYLYKSVRSPGSLQLSGATQAAVLTEPNSLSTMTGVSKYWISGSAPKRSLIAARKASS